MKETTESVKQLTNSLKKANIAVAEFNQSYYELILTTIGIKFTHIDGVYRIRYYVKDKYHNNHYSLIETNKLNSKLINTVWKYYKD